MSIRGLCSVIASVLVTAAALHAAGPAPVILTLWTEKAPLAGGTLESDIPTIHLYQVESNQPTAGVVVCPGGGYGHLAMDHEGKQIAEWFNGMGVTAAVCVYRHRGAGGNGGAGYGHPVPMLDAQRAIRSMRSNAKQWNLDDTKIGVLGFSAGGHLASTISTHHDSGNPESADIVDQQSSRPDFSILAYPVIALGQEITHRGSQKNLLGENADPELIQSLSNEKAVNAKTPPTFLFHTVEDTAVPVENSVVYFTALCKAGVPVEMHLFERGRHGVGLAAGMVGAGKWPDLCKAWLKSRNIVD